MTRSIKEAIKPAKKRRAPPPQFVGQVKELGDVMSSVSASDWGQLNTLAEPCEQYLNPGAKNN